jgi:hypothetical protein
VTKPKTVKPKINLKLGLSCVKDSGADLTFHIKQYGNSIHIVAKNALTETAILEFKPSGVVRRVFFVDKKIGVPLDKHGRVTIARN